MRVLKGDSVPSRVDANVPRTLGLGTPRRWVGLLVVIAGVLAVATPASAGVLETYCSGANLQNGWGCGGGSAFSGNIHVDITTSHTGCAALSSFGGYNSSPVVGGAFGGSVNLVNLACTNGSGTNGANALTTSHHGAIYNPNGSTWDYIYDAHISTA